MSIKTLNDQGAINLVQAIVKKAMQDFMATTPGSDARKEVEDFFLSDHFQALTGGDGSVVLKTLNEQYEKKRKKGKAK
jgi:hypothetical protein